MGVDKKVRCKHRTLTEQPHPVTPDRRHLTSEQTAAAVLSWESYERERAKARQSGGQGGVLLPTKTSEANNSPQYRGDVIDALEKLNPIWEELFTVRPEIKNGELTLLDRPGWGIELDEGTLNKRGVWA